MAERRFFHVEGFVEEGMLYDTLRAFDHLSIYNVQVHAVAGPLPSSPRFTAPPPQALPKPRNGSVNGAGPRQGPPMRERILAYLNAQDGPVTTKQLAEAMGLTTHNLYQHIHHLFANHQIEKPVAGQYAALGKGGPPLPQTPREAADGPRAMIIEALRGCPDYTATIFSLQEITGLERKRVTNALGNLVRDGKVDNPRRATYQLKQEAPAQ